MVYEKVAKLSESFFNKDKQVHFWESMNPSLRGFIELCQSNEDWTISSDESPDLFKDIAVAIPKITTYPLKLTEAEDIIHTLIPILSSMSFGNCMSSLIWMDNQSDDDIGWSVLIYMECIKLSRLNSHELNMESKNLVERIESIVRFENKVSLFKRGNVFTNIKNSNNRG